MGTDGCFKKNKINHGAKSVNTVYGVRRDITTGKVGTSLIMSLRDKCPVSALKPQSQTSFSFHPCQPCPQYSYASRQHHAVPYPVKGRRKVTT